MTTAPTLAVPPAATQPAPVVKHSIAEDVLGILTGTFIVSLGLYLLGTISAVTGGTAGLSLLVSYAAPVPFGVLFACINLPFFLLAVRAKGWDFTVRSGLSILLVAGFSALHPLVFDGIDLPPLYGVVAGNLLCGVGLLIVFRHRSSLGGFNIVALLLQERLGWRAGYVQMAMDGAVVLAALAVAPPLIVLLSAVGAVLLNLVVALNHRPGRYTGY